jgi:UDP-galactopyranose mutase
MALPLLQAVQPALVVYDCMDELASFKNPPKQLLQRENALLGIADLVFAGGPSLYEAKRNRHPNVHCFPSSVDVVHFQQALDRSRSHPQQDAIPHPRLGFYGVLDERFDPELVGEVADAHPEWQIVLAGPVVKIDPERLPRRPNIHYLGQQSYQVLPDLLAGWDVCLMPFAINEATRFISPTKVLEYMAAQLPIVSTPIADVANPYGHVVAIASGAREFIAACEAALAQTPEQRQHMVAAMQAVVSATSWDNTATRMRELMDNAPPHTGHAATRSTDPSDKAAAA